MENATGSAVLMASYIVHRVIESDTLRGLAVKYLGDHARWADIAALNNLLPGQYDLTGIKELQIPIEIGFTDAGSDPFLSDVQVSSGVIHVDDQGNITVRSGIDNYVQSILRALSTNMGELVTHPDYGMDLDRCVGVAGTALFYRFLKLEAERVIKRDPRTESVINVTVVQTPRTRHVQIGAVIKPYGTRDTIELSVDRRV